MRRHHRGTGGAGVAHAKANAAPIPDALSLIRTFNSETNPSRPIRPSPLTASPISGIPLDLLDRIRSFPLFLSAPESFLVAIGNHLRPQLHSAHDYILTEGDDAKAMYWLVRGAVAVTSRDGEATYAELKPGAFFGEIGILMDIPRTATIVARSRCLLVVLKKEDLRKELPKFPDVEQAIREEAQERLTILNRKKKESGYGASPAPVSLPARPGKRARGFPSRDVTMSEAGTAAGAVSANSKKRKSPSPGLTDGVATSSALGSGMVNVRQLLKELPLFSSLPAEILHYLGLSAQPRTYPPFTNIIQQNSQGSEIFFIVRGEVEVVDEKLGNDHNGPPTNGTYTRARRSQKIKARLKQGQYFGEVTSLSLAPRRTATVRSVASVECLMISGEVLNELWKRCSPNIRKQVEVTARKRLEDHDVPMTDAEGSTPPISDLEIADRPPKTPKRGSVPSVTFSHTIPESPHKPSRIEDRLVIEPCDPDPFLNADLDNIRSRSRRGSLAPPAPDANQTNNEQTNGQMSAYAQAQARAKHVTTPPEHYTTTKRPKTVPRRPTQFSKGLLPDDILVRIFQHFDVYEAMCLRLVSMHWCKLLTTSPSVLRTLDLRPYNRKVTDKALMSVICPFVGSRPVSVNISNCFHITDEGFTVLAAVCGANVRTWKMKSVWDITAQAVLEMANKAKGLEEVDLSNCRKVSDNLLARVVGWVVQEPSGYHQQMQQQQQQQNGRGGHHGQQQQHSGKPHQAQLMQAPPGTVIGCPKLKRLTLSYCKHVTDRSMAHLAVHAASRLEEIDLTRCTTITDQGFQHWSIYQFSRLTRLCLADCTYLSDNAIVYLTNAAKGLKELDLSFCCALSDTATEVLALGCPHLRILKLSFCGSAVSDLSLRSIGLHLLELQELSVRGCVRVTGIGVEAVVEGCVELRRFDVSQCKNLQRWIEAGGVERWRFGGPHHHLSSSSSPLSSTSSSSVGLSSSSSAESTPAPVAMGTGTGPAGPRINGVGTGISGPGMGTSSAHMNVTRSGLKRREIIFETVAGESSATTGAGTAMDGASAGVSPKASVGARVSGMGMGIARENPRARSVS
ncbi:MAG: hypothetical protein M1817_003358 [Caeruleum heppii]|nr:MAG: hypothetical protein M1817_003358 [Caeruleum heppii]